MSELKALLVEQLEDLLNAENQIVGALPKMASAAYNAKLKEAFQKHLIQTEGQADRLQKALELLGGDSTSKPCLGMKGLLDEGQELIKDSADKDELAADLALIGAAQKVEHYEISGYGTARCLAKHLGEHEVAKLLTQTLGEEESTDFLLTELTKPLMQQALSVELGNGTKAPWGEPGNTGLDKPFIESKTHAAAAGAGASGSFASSALKSSPVRSGISSPDSSPSSGSKTGSPVNSVHTLKSSSNRKARA